MKPEFEYVVETMRKLEDPGLLLVLELLPHLEWLLLLVPDRRRLLGRRERRVDRPGAERPDG